MVCLMSLCSTCRRSPELVRLRMLAEDSRRRSEDTSEAGRHLALISLDGACEYALWLAGRAHGAEIQGKIITQRHGLHVEVSSRRALETPRLAWRGAAASCPQ